MPLPSVMDARGLAVHRLAARARSRRRRPRRCTGGRGRRRGSGWWRPSSRIDVDGDAGLGRRARAGRDDDVRGREGARSRRRRSASLRTTDGCLAELAHVAREVVDERVVVVEKENHACASAGEVDPERSACERSMSARALSRVSRYSCSGSESATMPPPAWKVYPPADRLIGADDDAGVHRAGEARCSRSSRSTRRGATARARR